MNEHLYIYIYKEENKHFFFFEKLNRPEIYFLYLHINILNWNTAFKNKFKKKRIEQTL